MQVSWIDLRDRYQGAGFFTNRNTVRPRYMLCRRLRLSLFSQGYRSMTSFRSSASRRLAAALAASIFMFPAAVMAETTAAANGVSYAS